MLRVVEGASSGIVTIHSPVLGRVDVDVSGIITFTEPIAGFPDGVRYVLVPYSLAGREDPSMRWLQAAEPPYQTFLVTDPWSAAPEYQPEIADGELRELHADGLAQTTLLGILTVARSTRELTINLQAPLVINASQGLAKQVLILNNEAYSRRFRVCALP